MRKELQGKRMVLIADTNPDQETIAYARSLRAVGVVILSTGGTAKCLRANGILTQEISLRSDFVSDFSALFSITEAEPPPELSVAPELWHNRQDRKETPPDFIRRVYVLWIGNLLTKQKIKKLDIKLYTAIYNWVQRNTWPANLRLLTLREVNDKKLASAGKLKRPSKSKKMSELTPEANAAARLYYINQRRRRKKKS
jgi:MGS-like domain